MDAIELHRLSATIITNLCLDDEYGVESQVSGTLCVWTCASGLETVSGLIDPYAYVSADENFVLQEE